MQTFIKHQAGLALAGALDVSNTAKHDHKLPQKRDENYIQLMPECRKSLTLLLHILAG